MSNKGIISIILGLLVALGLSKSLYVIEETERGLLLNFGKIVLNDEGKAEVNQPGLHFRIPIKHKVVLLDARVQIMDGTPDKFTTQNKEFLDVNSYVQWRISDFEKFYVRTNGNINKAEGFLEQFVDNGLRNQFGKRTLQQAISGERGELMGDIKIFVNSKVPEYGMKVIDIRVKKVNYTSRVLQNVYEQIKSERGAQAILIRSDGQQAGNIVRAKADAEVLRIYAVADEYDRTIRGEADGKAAKVYADTFNQDVEFYSFLRSLDAYKASFNSKNDIMVINHKSEFFKYFNKSKIK